MSREIHIYLSHLFFILVDLILIGSDGKESACNVGDLGPIPGLQRSPREGNSYPLQYPGLENSWGCKESDTTE